jgi:hypothetical protein
VRIPVRYVTVDVAGVFASGSASGVERRLLTHHEEWMLGNSVPESCALRDREFTEIGAHVNRTCLSYPRVFPRNGTVERIVELKCSWAIAILGESIAIGGR